jgi:hypothetical protein
MDLKALFAEKLNNKKNDELPVEVKKKIKKKDIEKVSIEDLELKYYEFDVIDGIKIYNGLVTEKKEKMERTIQLLNMFVTGKNFTALTPSVLSVQGSFSNVLFNEELQMPLYNIPSKEYSTIVKIGCNFGEIYLFPNIHMPHSLDSMLKSIRELKGNNILIGCSCQNPLDVQKVLSFQDRIKQSAESLEVLKQYFTAENLEANGVAKSRVNALVKSLNDMLQFKVTDAYTINDLYCAIDNNVNKKHIDICNKYIDLIVNTIKIFTTYARNCKCWKKCQYTSIFAPTTRGRKAKAKKESKRKKQGTGTYFSSMIQIDIFNEINNKLSKIKLFRNGGFQVPGCKYPDMRDLIKPLTTIRNYWNSVNETKSEVSYMLSNMRNYKCHLVDDTLTILINRLEDILHFEKDMPSPTLENYEYFKLLESLGLSPATNETIFKYVNFSFFVISEINNNPERHPGILIKFNRPIPSRENKKLTIKILSSGKINFDGGNSELEIYELYYWIQFIFAKYWDEIIYNPKQFPFETVSSDSDNYKSVYDSS